MKNFESEGGNPALSGVEAGRAIDTLPGNTHNSASNTASILTSCDHSKIDLRPADFGFTADMGASEGGEIQITNRTSTRFTARVQVNQGTWSPSKHVTSIRANLAAGWSGFRHLAVAGRMRRLHSAIGIEARWPHAQLAFLHRERNNRHDRE